jgi:hypothetical protein
MVLETEKQWHEDKLKLTEVASESKHKRKLAVSRIL